jgi:hypothetical protein
MLSWLLDFLHCCGIRSAEGENIRGQIRSVQGAVARYWTPQTQLSCNGCSRSKIELDKSSEIEISHEKFYSRYMLTRYCVANLFGWKYSYFSRCREVPRGYIRMQEEEKWHWFFSLLTKLPLFCIPLKALIVSHINY